MTTYFFRVDDLVVKRNDLTDSTWRVVEIVGRGLQLPPLVKLQRHNRNRALMIDWVQGSEIDLDAVYAFQRVMEAAMDLDEHRHKHTRDNSWWLKDAKGIELARVCGDCEELVRQRYRPEVLGDHGRYEDVVDDVIEPED